MVVINNFFYLAHTSFGCPSIAFTLAAPGSFFILFSARGIRFRAKYHFFAWIAGFGIAPGFVIGYAAGLVTGEISLPQGVFDRFFIAMPLDEMITSFSALGIGMPSLNLWISGISLAIVAYILAFGDILVLEAMLKDCNESRKDQFIRFEIPRNHVITAFRNIFQGVCVPFLPLCGPQWTGGQALVVNRFKHSTPDQQPSYWGGAALVSANYVTLWDNAFWSGPTLALIVGTMLYFLLEHDA